MRITVKPRKGSEKSKNIEDLKPGTVFKFGNGVIALKLNDNAVLSLKFSSRRDWLQLSDGSMDYHGVSEILGCLDEIIVVEG